MIRLFANFLIVVGLAGFAVVTALPRLPAAIQRPVGAVLEPVLTLAEGNVSTTTRPSANVLPAPRDNAITRLVIPSIGLDTDVAPAGLVEHDGASSWDVPKFVAGHAEGSAGAGEPGNAVLIGHVTSLTLGNVFEHLNEVSVGDLVYVYSVADHFTYRVTDARDVARTDVGVLDRTEEPSVTLITCSGLWLPSVRDYTERRVVRGQLTSTHP